MCPDCLERFELAIIREFGTSFSLLQVGVCEERSASLERFFIIIPPREVALEDGARHMIEEFAIRNEPISVGEFREFVDGTGYVPLAIRTKADNAYDDNPLLKYSAYLPLDGTPAYFLSFLDAQAYCKWARRRLPTEAEWLAASLLDEREATPLDEGVRLQQLAGRPDRLMCDGLSLTADRVGELVVARRRPFLLKTVGWESEASSNRLLISVTDCVGIFYICRPSSDRDIRRQPM
jgi:hypothetical protein